MRLNFSSSTLARVAMSSVLARPGTPTIRLLPPTKSESSTSSMTSPWPMMSLPISWRICLRPWFIRSASATSSADSKSVVFVVTGSLPVSSPGRPSAGCRGLSVRQSVHDVVHAEFICLVRFVDGFDPGIRPFPELGNIGVVIDHHHQALRRVVVFVDAAEHRPAAVVVVSLVVVVRDVFEGFDLKERVLEDGIFDREVVKARLRQDAVHVRLEHFPVEIAEIV